MEIKPISEEGNIQRVVSIDYIGTDTSFVDTLLKKKCQDDIVFERYAEFAIGCIVRNPEACIYRWLFEGTYLRKDTVSKYIPDKNFVLLRVSLSEILQFISTATPPRLREHVWDISCIADIINALKMFLMEKSDYLQYYLKTFENVLRFGKFDTFWSYNSTRLMHKFSTEGQFVRVVDAYDENSKTIRMTYAISATPEHVYRIGELARSLRISNVTEHTKGAVYLIALAGINKK